MFRLIDDSDRSDAGTLRGVQVCGGIAGVGALAWAFFALLFGMATFLDMRDHAFRRSIKSFLMLSLCLAFTYALIKIRTGLFNGSRRAQLGGITWGVLLLFFCWIVWHDAQEPSNPKAPDAQELDGPIFFVTAPTALWLIGYLSTKRVTVRFLGSRAEE